MSADGAHQQQTGDIDTGDQENNRHGKEQRSQQWPNVCDIILAQGRNVSLNVNGRKADREIAHDLLGYSVRIRCGLRDRDITFQPRHHVVSKETGGIV